MVEEEDDIMIMDEPSASNNDRMIMSKQAARVSDDAEHGPSKRRKLEPGADQVISLE